MWTSWSVYCKEFMRVFRLPFCLCRYEFETCTTRANIWHTVEQAAAKFSVWASICSCYSGYWEHHQPKLKQHLTRDTNRGIDSYPSHVKPMHSSEIRVLCLMKCSSETIQNLPYFWNMKNHVDFFIFHFILLYFFPNECPLRSLVYVNIDQGIH